MSESLLALLVATLGGAAVGVERQWSGHASGPEARFAGVRTFALIGTLGGIAGRLWVWSAPGPALVILSIAGGLIIAGYLVASRVDVDATTEVAALVVMAAGTMAGIGEMGVASAVIALTALLLVEKSRLHEFVAYLSEAELRAAFRFAVMAIVILPLLPAGPVGSWGGGLRPRELWLLVLFFSGLSFLGYVAQRVIGVSQGYVVAGLLGGIVSSTNVTWAHARQSREQPALARPLALGAVAANSILYVRVLLAASVLSPALSLALLPALAMPWLIGAVSTLAGFRRAVSAEGTALGGIRNPLQLRSALEMAVLFQIVLLAVALVGSRFGSGGLLATAAVLGLTDVDALTLAMAHEAGGTSVTVTLAARAVAVGLLANTCLKAAVALAAGAPAFRRITVTVLSLMAAALLGAVVLMPAR